MANKKEPYGQNPVEKRFPLHWMVWESNLRGLNLLLETKEQDLELVDPRGRTPLHLAISLGHIECVKALLRHGANANAENAGFWSALHEATSTGDPEMVQIVLQYRDYQRFLHRTDGIPSLLKKLREAPDFYVEMRWEFASWVPLVARMCPSDTYKVYKSGSMVRIDTTLLGFDSMKWERGNRSYIFKGEADKAMVMEVDHDACVVYCETVHGLSTPPSIDLLLPSDDQVSSRLTAPVAVSYIDSDKIEFERSKSGVWGWRTDKSEIINGYDCRVFSATNVQFITKTRTEHLSDQDKKASKKNKSSLTPIESFLGLAEKHTEKSSLSQAAIMDIHNPCSISPEEYFNAELDLGGKDIGRPRETQTKIQKFKANLSLCEQYPLTLQEQVLPIIDLMAATNAHFRKLKDFITLQLPAGFPVKIEIPIFHVLTARVTFGNLYSCDAAVEGVSVIQDGEVTACAVDEIVFNAPDGYNVVGSGSHNEERYVDQDDQLLQFAIQQSLLNKEVAEENVTLMEALTSYTQQPLSSSPQRSRVLNAKTHLDYDAQLELALAMSREEVSSPASESDDLARREQEELDRILALSLIEK